MDPIQRANVPQAIADRIIDLITRGELGLGDQLPSQRELAKQLGVGVSSVRESLQSLTAMGLVQMQPGRGTFVSESFDGLAGRYAAVAPLASSQELRDLLEARRYLDTAVIEMACRRASDGDLATIRRAFEDMQAAAASGDMAALERADLAFHLGIAEAAHNDVMAHLIRSVVNLISNQIRATPYSLDVIAEHGLVLEALEARDVARAKEAVIKIIASSAKHLVLEDAPA
jgi:GntR family transcriptional repressor for pyruvate dehydrogenase complex